MKNLIAILLLLITTTAYSKPPRWENIGPDGGYVRKLIPDRRNPGIWFCVTQFQIYRSKDGGISWTPVLTQSKDLDLAVQPSTSTVYAWNKVNLWKSTDTGRTFQSFCAHNCPVTIYPHPMDANFLLGTVYERQSQLAVSSNGGATWSTVSGPKSLQEHGRSLSLYGAFYLPFQPETIYVSASYRREGSDESHSVLLVTRDRFRSWSIVNHGHSFSFHSDPLYPDRAFAFDAEGIYRIDSSGWTKISDFEVQGYGSLIDVPHSPDELYYQEFDRIFRSTDGGVHWNPALKDLRVPRKRDLAVLDSPDRTLLLATDYGIYRRINGSWQLSSDGLHEFLDIAGIWNSGNRLLVIADSAFYQRVSNQNWQVRFFDRDPWIFPDPLRSDHWFLSARELRETTDGGKTWTDTGRRDDEVYFDPGLANHLFFHLEDSWQESFDGGRTTTTLPFSMRNVIQFFVEGTARNVFYFFTTFGVYRTDDGGNTLRKADAGLKIRNLKNAVPLGPPGHFLVLCANEILKTENSGDRWSHYAGLPPDFQSMELAVVDAQGRHLLALSKRRLLESTDGGKNWTDITPPLEGAQLRRILDSRQSPLTVASTRGLFRRMP